MSLIWVQVHLGPFRDRSMRYIIPMTVTVCVLWLIHLPRLPGVVHSAESPVAVHFHSEWETLPR
jgi:hypothetical protein